MQQDTNERLEDLRRQARAADANDRALVEDLQKLTCHGAYFAFQMFLNRRIEMFSQELLGPAGSIDGLIAHEFVKGAMFGLILARDLPQVIVASLSHTAEDEQDD